MHTPRGGLAQQSWNHRPCPSPPLASLSEQSQTVGGDDDETEDEKGWDLRDFRRLFYAVIFFFLLAIMTVPMQKLCGSDWLRVFSAMETMCFNHGT